MNQNHQQIINDRVALMLGRTLIEREALQVENQALSEQVTAMRHGRAAEDTPSVQNHTGGDPAVS